MKFAVVRISGKQFLVNEGSEIEVTRTNESKLKEAEVLAYGDGDKVQFGKPVLKDIKVELSLVEDKKGKKVIATKFRAKKHSKTRVGHRQKLSVLKTGSIKE